MLLASLSFFLLFVLRDTDAETEDQRAFRNCEAPSGDAVHPGERNGRGWASAS